MASRSPIVVNSSSQASFRFPSVTPQSHRKTAEPAESSSPCLPELPTFFKVSAKALKSGSNAQQVPDGAASGFASAARLLKNDVFRAELEKKDQQDAESLGTGKNHKSTRLPEKSTGKLSKTKKTQKLAKDVTEKRRKSQSPFPPTLDNGREPSVDSTANETAPYFGQTKTRTPSISLSEYDFHPEEHQESPVPRAASTKVQKKSKPRVPKEKQSKEDDATKKSKRQTAAKPPPAKKPKKRLAKSESIILNSDQPDQVVDGQAAPARNFSMTDGDRHKSIAKSSEVSLNQPVDDNKQSPETFAFLVQKAMMPHDDGAAVEFLDKSVYFSVRRPEEDSADFHQKVITNNNGDAPPSLNKGSPVLLTLVAAPRRRLSWTPVKNTTRVATTPTERPGTASSTGSEMPTKSLATLVIGFGYADQPSVTASHERTVTGEALTKRRRIELADVSTVAPAKRKSANVEPLEPAKKPKTKKKPQTITALATKAYHIEPDVNPAQSTVSEFFAAPDTIVPSADTSAGPNFVKPKKPRKPRAKKAEGDTVSQSVKRPAKSKKTKAKLHEAGPMAKLYTPDEARAQEQSQDFLFGSSSQLAAEESPAFIREMQAAIQESESWPGNLSTCLRWKSRIQVPSAPHGTSLSIGQGKLDHWSSATRDEDGNFLVEDKMLKRVDPQKVSPSDVSIVAAASHVSEQVSGRNGGPEGSVKSLEGTKERLLKIALSPKNLSAILDMPNDVDGSYTIDLCQTSPAVEDSDAAANASTRLPEEGDLRPIADPGANRGQEFPSPVRDPADEIWTFLSSDDSGQQPTGPLVDPISMRPASPNLRPVSRPPQLIRSATSPSMHRTALQNLDANICLLSHTSPAKGVASMQQRAFTSAPADQTKRPRGRPRKNAAPTSPPASSPKRRGRPPKVASGAVTAAVSSRARPSKAARTGLSASQPTESTGWTNIDEISDSDSPSTPSPPRRRAGSTPPTMQPLDLSVADSPSLKARAPAAVISSILKLDDASFSTIQAQLFPEITATVRSTPPSTDMNNPTWHEKILLYDPIVLEDLTAWLNEQGLGIETQRLKPKAKSKGRKKKDAPVEEPEYEVVKEELKPWMVQKWCEEKSICCLWKEGLRGGVRNRY